MTADSIEERMDLNMQLIARSIPDEIEILTVHGDADEVIPLADARKFDEYISSSTLIVLAGADHAYTYYESELTRRVVEWIRPRINFVEVPMDPTIASL